MSETRTLWCLIEGDPEYFDVTAPSKEPVIALKRRICEERKNRLRNFDPVDLVLWKVNINVHENSLETLTVGENDQGVEKLSPRKSVLDYWPSQPSYDFVHVFVHVPATGKGSESPQLTITDPSKPYVHLLNVPGIFVAYAPSSWFGTTRNFTLRKWTVEGLYDAMMQERLIYVRGTPGSGKSILLDLLHRHILQKDPNAFVCVTVSWPPVNLPFSSSNMNLYSLLQTIIPDFPRRKSRAFLLMDEAQESFGDSYLWHSFLKDIIDKPSWYRVVIFCFYGSISTPGEGTSGGTPTDLRRAARMTLWPRKVEEGMEVNGLLLDRDEFDEVVLQFNQELAIDPDLSEQIFKLTAGHVGAVCELLRLILDKMKTGHIIQSGEPVTLDTFYEKLSLDYIMDNLAGAFTRGLPNYKKLLGLPDVSRVLRRLLVSGRVTESSDNNAAIQYCHCHGWIYAEDVLEPGPQSYTLASPLHHAALSWRVQAMDYLPQFQNPYTLSLQVLAKFKPSQMELPIRRVDGGSNDLPPEAQYQDEYYRSLLAVTCGNVHISPEFASARGAKVAGRVDFFIPGVKWGIEITREGDRLDNHPSRFKADGAYSQWLKDGDMTDCILLDCRTTTPKTSHSDIPNLYHVVFNEKYTEVRVFNNKMDQVWGPRTLQENHNDHAMLL